MISITTTIPNEAYDFLKDICNKHELGIGKVILNAIRIYQLYLMGYIKYDPPYHLNKLDETHEKLIINIPSFVKDYIEDVSERLNKDKDTIIVEALQLYQAQKDMD